MTAVFCSFGHFQIKLYTENLGQVVFQYRNIGWFLVFCAKYNQAAIYSVLYALYLKGTLLEGRTFFGMGLQHGLIQPRGKCISVMF